MCACICVCVFKMFVVVILDVCGGVHSVVIYCKNPFPYLLIITFFLCHLFLYHPFVHVLGHILALFLAPILAFVVNFGLSHFFVFLPFFFVFLLLLLLVLSFRPPPLPRTPTFLPLQCWRTESNTTQHNTTQGSAQHRHTPLSVVQPLCFVHTKNFKTIPGPLRRRKHCGKKRMHKK